MSCSLGTRLVALLLLALPVAARARADDAKPVPLDGPLTPEQAPRSFRLEPGLRVELVAAEPLVVSPVALAFDERGRLYVAEDRGYPTGPGEGKPPVGRVALLEDTDGDGRMDRRTEFAEGLTYPNGVLPWKGGVIVTCAPDVLYLRDTDGDGKADEKRVLFTGFSTKGSTQLRVSHPVLSIDNWVYLTSGLTGGKVVSPSAPAGRAPVELGRTDFRFRPDGDGDDYEPADGGAQFGQTFDDFGRRFICYNRVQVQHVVIASKVLRRNPLLAFTETVQNCPADMVAEPLKGHGASARLFPISRNVTTADSHAGTFTAACAVFVYRGTGLPDGYRGGAFSCDPTGNLVHFDRLDPDGVTFAARRARPGVEFLASTDNWFRPVFLAAGPDGGLYVADMYRKTIEHPDYLPVEIRKRTDFESGKTMGRVWRVVRADPGRRPDGSRLERAFASPAARCETLRAPDGWWRDTAHRLLLEQDGRDAVEPLRALVKDPATPPVTLANALHLLERFNALPDDVLRDSLKHSAAPVRETALQLVEPRFARPDQPDWLTGVLRLADDDDARVRFQAAIALGAAKPGARAAEVAKALAHIAVRGGTDRWLRAAVFSATEPTAAFLTALRASRRPGEELPAELLVEYGRELGASPSRSPGGAGSVALAAKPLLEGPPIESAALLAGFAEGRRQASRNAPGAPNVLAELASAAETRAVILALNASLRKTALDASDSPAHRRTAVDYLASTGYDESGPALLGLAEPGQPLLLQAAAVRGLATQRDARVTAELLTPGRFAAYTPDLREEVLSALLAQTYHVPGVLKAVETGAVPPGAVDALHRRQLTQHRDPAIKQWAEKLFGAVAGDRARVYDAYKDVASAQSDPAHGRAVFRRECASCHRLDGEGSAVGPDLFGIRNQPKEAILLHVLVPDHEITPGFAAYTLATKDGRVLTGLVASETPTSLTLRQALGKEDTILRSEIDELAASKQSLMPQGLEKNISRQEFADLLGYLKGEAGRD